MERSAITSVHFHFFSFFSSSLFQELNEQFGGLGQAFLAFFKIIYILGEVAELFIVGAHAALFELLNHLSVGLLAGDSAAGLGSEGMRGFPFIVGVNVALVLGIAEGSVELFLGEGCVTVRVHHAPDLVEDAVGAGALAKVDGGNGSKDKCSREDFHRFFL